MYRQLINFNQKAAGNKAGYCLANTRLGFGINSKYGNAWEAWTKTDRHTEPLPDNVDVPVYFSYKNEQNGHIGVRLANGKFWSDGSTYASIQDYESKKAPRYVGWSTSINGVPVLDYVADPNPNDQSSWVGKTLHLSAEVDKWAFYRTDTPLPVVRKNKAGELAPKKWNGLSYVILEVVAPNTVKVHSPSLGDILIYVDQDATLS